MKSFANKISEKLDAQSLILPLGFLLVFLFASFAAPRFFTAYNLQSMAYQLPEFGLLTLAMMIVILSGGINLSIIYTASLSVVVGGVLLSHLNAAGVAPFWAILICIGATLAVSVLCGLLNGWLVGFVGISPILTTLGTMTLFEGIALYITKGGAISGFPEEFLVIGNSSILGIPLPLLIFIIALLLFHFLLNKSEFGLKVYMVGSSEKATRFSGIDVKSVYLQIYVLSALFCGLAGLIMASRYNSAKESYGISYLLQSVATVVLGGTSIMGGEGKLRGTIFAILIVQVVSSGLNIIGLNTYLTNVIMGAILVVVLATQFLTSKTTRNKSEKDSNKV